MQAYKKFTLLIKLANIETKFKKKVVLGKR